MSRYLRSIQEEYDEHGNYRPGSSREGDIFHGIIERPKPKRCHPGAKGPCSMGLETLEKISDERRPLGENGFIRTETSRMRCFCGQIWICRLITVVNQFGTLPPTPIWEIERKTSSVVAGER